DALEGAGSARPAGYPNLPAPGGHLGRELRAKGRRLERRPADDLLRPLSRDPRDRRPDRLQARGAADPPADLRVDLAGLRPAASRHAEELPPHPQPARADARWLPRAVSGRPRDLALRRHAD